MKINWDAVTDDQRRMLVGDIMGNMEEREKAVCGALQAAGVPRDMVSALALMAVVAELCARSMGTNALEPTIHIFDSLLVQAVEYHEGVRAKAEEAAASENAEE